MTLQLRIKVSEAEEDVEVDVRVHRASQSRVWGVGRCGDEETRSWSDESTAMRKALDGMDNASLVSTTI